ncbi:hypothetical protein N7478_008774 [Penicillium angulare]|uniref:uncharacterized protein n=1 Tax=Penicillium angulare TaxID=116970 RepID=UPI002540225B|nr:uncharacterized protein N7478_008774 [Penicillium angulare]KAJ5273649.1 hypothetical protein N7478_008774 [Penicillium angulare]
MADNGSPKPQFLAPPAVTALRQEARNINPKMTRTLSENMREEREDLKEAAEQTLNIIVDLDLEGRIKWVSPSWRQVVGTAPASVEGRMISEILLGNKDVFKDAIDALKEDDSRSRFIRFAVQMGPDSVLKYAPEPRPMETEQKMEDDKSEDTKESLEHSQVEGEQNNDVLTMEGQGIMVYERDDDGHSMWMLRPFTEPREVTIDLPPLLVESLGVGAEVLANYLTTLAEAAANEPDPSKHPAPTPVLCRICERQITPWWFEKHSDLCLQEHRAEMDVQIAQENLNEHRHMIVKVLDALEARQGRPLITPDGNVQSPPQPEYKGLPIGPPPTSSTPSSAPVSSGNSAPGTPPRSRDHSASGLPTVGRPRSFTVRRPLARIVELVLDLCDTALEISMPMIKESSRAENPEDFRTLSPQSESRITQVAQWQSPSSNTLEQEQGLAALASDTEQIAKVKVDSVVRHRKIVEYAERIRIEYTVLVEECITAALSKAERIAAGQLSDSTCSSDNEAQEDIAAGQIVENDFYNAGIPLQTDETPLQVPPLQRSPLAQSQLAGPTPRKSTTSALTMSMRNSPDRALLGQTDTKSSSSTAVSTGSNSPMECPTPRSYKSAAGLLGTSQPGRRGLSLMDIDPGDSSDSSIPSSVFPGAIRTDSPSSERSFDRKRRSLVLPGLSSSPRRQPSPARAPGPHSPLRMPKPRHSYGAESLPSPVVSPSTYTSELAHNCRHHRRQSSATSSDVAKPPPSPRLPSMSQQPRPAPPSIKDFEIIKPISKGAFGSVYLSKKKSTGEYYAIKVLKKQDMVAKNQVTNVKAERAIMMWQGESDFVAKLYWTFSSKDYLYLVMEYLNGGDCASLVKILGGLPEDWAMKYIAEVVLGIEHLHSRGIVHRDLKPDNLLIDASGHLKLTDFGLSRMGLVGRQKRLLKSPNESAPDLLKQGPFPRAISIASSRSASFDFQAGSPGSTPLITPDNAVGTSQPSYFSLNQTNLNQTGLSRQSSRRASGYRSDSAGSDSLNGMFRTFSLNDNSHDPAAPSPSMLSSNLAEEEVQSETDDSPQLYPLLPTFSNPAHNTPPSQSMLPPVMALFDPEDHDRRFVGTPDYLAPETINGIGQDEISDWWSMGCIMFEFIFGYPPFNAATPDEVFENILQRRINWPEEPEDYTTAESLDLMNKLMTLNPRERIGANVEERFTSGGAEIRAHPWFSDIHWDTLFQDKAEFVPNLENPEDTEYFDARGATLQAFAEEMEDEPSPQPPSTSGSYPDRPHDALFKVRSQVNSMKRPLMPLHIPPHVRDARDSRSRRLSEPALADDFGSFNFKNLPMLEKANKDVIQKMRQEAMQAQHRQPSASSSTAQTPLSASQPSLEGSPLPMSLQRALSQNKGNNRPSSPSSLSQANSSPSRPSQPSSPLLVQFSTGTNHERRKTSGSSSTASHQSSGNFQPSSVEQNRMPNLRLGSVASSPVKANRMPAQSPDKHPSNQRHGSAPASRARSQTIGSQDGGDLSSFPKEPFIPSHHKRRSQLFDISPSSSDNEDPRTKALLKVQRRRQSSRRLSQFNVQDGPFFRPLDVLICEDHPVSRLVMERLFEKLRCRTITVTNGAEAVRYALSEVQFDVIMTEYKLPQVNGADFARMVRETRSPNRHTPIIAVTGYLKDLPETHYFDALVEKPPTLSKLTETLCKWCMWKPPPKDYNPSQPLPVPMPSVRPAQLPNEDNSPSSASSGFVPNPPSSYRGSSRDDSVSSSVFGDMDNIKPDDVPVIVSRSNDDWDQSGLGISEDAHPGSPDPKAVPVPQLLHAISAPAAMDASGALTPRKQRSSEAIRAKRESLERKRYEGAESGDDEDEELGNAQARRSPPTRNRRPGSKLGIEMMRTNSRGSVVSGSEELLKKEREALRRRSGEFADTDTDDGALGSPASTTLEERFEDLSIPEESEAEERLSEQYSPPLSGSASSFRRRRPSLAHHDTEIYSGHGPTSHPVSETGTERLSKAGQTTPPWETSGTSTGPITPEVKISGDTISSDASGVDTDCSPTPDSEATPRPLHPSLSLDSEETPRPAERFRSDLTSSLKR